MDMYRTCAPQKPGVSWARFYDDVIQLNKFQFQFQLKYDSSVSNSLMFTLFNYDL
jgi:hypothetical protein